MNRKLLALFAILGVVFLFTACSNDLNLTVREPKNGETVRSSPVTIRGDVSHKDAKLMINDNEVSIHSEYRTFYHTVNLESGENTIVFVLTRGEEELAKEIVVTFEPY